MLVVWLAILVGSAAPSFRMFFFRFVSVFVIGQLVLDCLILSFWLNFSHLFEFTRWTYELIWQRHLVCECSKTKGDRKSERILQAISYGSQTTSREDHFANWPIDDQHFLHHEFLRRKLQVNCFFRNFHQWLDLESRLFVSFFINQIIETASLQKWCTCFAKQFSMKFNWNVELESCIFVDRFFVSFSSRFLICLLHCATNAHVTQY